MGSNPLLEKIELQRRTPKAANADFGVAFDGDFDRCFIFDNEGNLYLVNI